MVDKPNGEDFGSPTLIMLVVALLESMWDWRSMTSDAGYTQAPRYFRINPQNHSGRRLYRIVGDNHLLVTNACRELAGGPNKHGVPDRFWVAENIKLLEEKFGIDILLLCGKVAQEAYRASTYKTYGYVIPMMHPASRTWTNEALDKLARRIQRFAHVIG